MPEDTKLAPTLERYNAWGHSSGESRASLKEGAVANPAAQSVQQSWFDSLLLYASSSSGVAVNRQTALGVSTVYACLDVLASSIGSLPLNLYRRGDSENERFLAKEHPLFYMLHDAPNEEMTSMDFRQALEANRSLHKNAYAQIVRSRGGEILGLYPLETHDVTPRYELGAMVYQVNSAGRSFTLRSDEVLHLKGLSFNGLCAPDMLRTVKDVVGLAIALDKNAAMFFKNGSFPGGFLSTPDKLSNEAVERLKAQFHGGTSGDSAHRIRVLEQNLTYKEGRTPNSDSQFDESRDRQAKEIARYWRVPVHKVNITTNQPRANVEQENLSFVIDTLRPICVGWEQALNMKLLRPEERGKYFFEFNLSGLLRGDAKTRHDIYTQGINNGMYSPNECRKWENLNPRKGGDIYLQPLNMTESGGAPSADDE